MLTKILATKRTELETLQLPEERTFEKQPLLTSLREGAALYGVGLIAEVKKASPSKGSLNENLDPVSQARLYEESGAQAVSVLTDETYFHGKRADLTAVKEAVHLPVLRKDFILEEVQIEESARIGADAVLLIASALSPAKLKSLHEAAERFGMEALVEVHNAEELQEVLREFQPPLIGVNNRNLETFETSLSVTEEVAPYVPEDVFLISESAIHTSDDAARAASAGAQGLLVGEALVTHEHPADAVASLRGGAGHGSPDV
ncbi:indole-3-glycerol phosphate synthase [Salsuginibacillus halophilus]|uniref:Indole-3-glycerol phosphate synthase n=1 Tax=Salsuginibacillus halophilus TaxID=517424 RepID=A0A2P8HW96_9BACI|nr:indole-3-glycerol phosphate synthase TrpC [Salsuginibacillus halophilus]PSL50500.1 indole-3-glycerol phosphate synthase [Salsuginibacillus halophilus]